MEVLFENQLGILRLRISAGALWVALATAAAWAAWTDFQRHGPLGDLIESLLSFRHLCPPVVELSSTFRTLEIAFEWVYDFGLWILR